MELAKNLAQWRDQAPEQWVNLANRILPPIVITIVVILIAAQAVQLMWVLLDRPADQDLVPPTQVAQAVGDSQQVAWSLDSAYGLFGQAPTAEDIEISRSEIDSIPETDLNLTLSGLLVAQELPEPGSTIVPEAGMAIIGVGRASQQALRTGVKIDGVANATLYMVFEDRVVIDRGGGRTEALFYRPDENNPQSAQLRSSLTRRTTASAAAPITPLVAASAAEELSGLASTLSQHMTMESAVDAGEITGMRLQPKGDSDVFSQLGFEPGDVMLEVNGLRVNNLRNVQAVSQALTETSQASVRVRRNGTDQVIIVNLADIQRLADSRQ